MRSHAHSPPVGDESDCGLTVGLPRFREPRRHPRLLATVAPLRGREGGQPDRFTLPRPQSPCQHVRPGGNAGTIRSTARDGSREAPARCPTPITGGRYRPASQVDGSRTPTRVGVTRRPGRTPTGGIPSADRQTKPEASQRVAGGRSAAKTTGTAARHPGPRRGPTRTRVAGDAGRPPGVDRPTPPEARQTPARCPRRRLKGNAFRLTLHSTRLCNPQSLAVYVVDVPLQHKPERRFTRRRGTAVAAPPCAPRPPHPTRRPVRPAPQPGRRQRAHAPCHERKGVRKQSCRKEE